MLGRDAAEADPGQGPGPSEELLPGPSGSTLLKAVVTATQTPRDVHRDADAGPQAVVCCRPRNLPARLVVTSK